MPTFKTSPVALVRDGLALAGSTRPQNPTHGAIFYDTNLRQLLTYDATIGFWVGERGYKEGAAGSVVMFTDFKEPALPSFLTITEGSDTEATSSFAGTAETGEVVLTCGDSNGAVTADGVVIDSGLEWEAEENGGIWAVARLKVNSIADVAFQFVLTDILGSSAIEDAFSLSGTTYTSNASDACGFLYDSAATTDTLRLVGVDTDVDATHVDTSVAPVADTYLKLGLYLATDGTLTGYINDTAYTTVASAATPGTNLTPAILVDGRTTTSKNLTIDYLGCRPVNVL